MRPATRRSLLVPAAFALLSACHPATSSAPPDNSGGNDSGENSGQDTGDAPTDLGRYDPTHLTMVEGQLDPEDWISLTQETRLFYEEVLGPDCFDGPADSVFSWYPGSVTVDGESLGEIGFRKKGFIGSLSWTRPSLKLDSDRFVEGQHFADGTEHFTLNNNNQDPSRLHTCLAYNVFQAAGVPAPDCAFAAVRINSEALGVYSNVQPIKTPFLEQNFGDASGDLYEGTSSDFSEDFLLTFEIDSDGSTLAPLEALATALELPDDQLMEGLAQVIDVDAFIRFWAVEGLIGHWDGYAKGRNNFHVYKNPSDGLLHFVPWGADAVFEDPSDDPVLVGGLLARRLWSLAEGRALWTAETQRLLDDVWDEAALHAEIDRMEALVAPHLLDASVSANHVDEVRRFVDGRRSVVEATLASPPPATDWRIEERTCLEPIGALSASFSLDMGADLEGDPFAGTASLSGEANGTALHNAAVGVLAGPNEDGDAVVAVIGLNSSYSEFVQVVLVLPPALQAGTYDVDIAAVTGYVLKGSTAGGDAEVVGLMGGEVEFDALSYQPGEPISGTIEAMVIPFPFG